jgi:hypothetical protein
VSAAQVQEKTGYELEADASSNGEEEGDGSNGSNGNYGSDDDGGSHKSHASHNSQAASLGMETSGSLRMESSGMDASHNSQAASLSIAASLPDRIEAALAGEVDEPTVQALLSEIEASVDARLTPLAKALEGMLAEALWRGANEAAKMPDDGRQGKDAL